jgi:hypothetical protein
MESFLRALIEEAKKRDLERMKPFTIIESERVAVVICLN